MLNYYLKLTLTLSLLLIGTYITHAQISGIVFRDYNGNGVKENTSTYNEPFVEGVTVSAYPASGSSQTTTTNSSGAYSFSGLTFPVRIEFSGYTTGDYSGPYGTQNKSSVQFYTASTTTANFCVNYPDDYWDTNKEYRYIVPQYWNGEASAGSTNPGLVSTLYGSTGLNSDYLTYNNSPGTGPVPQYELLKSEIGSVWGEAYHKSQKHLYLTTFLKRHVGMADGPGYIYNVDYSSGSAVLSGKFDLQGVTPSNGGSAIDFGTVTRTGGADYTLPSNVSTPNRDLDAFGKVATMSYGDADMQPGTDYLWTVNLYQQALIRVDVAGSPTSVPSDVRQFILGSLPGYPSSSTGELRPWALKFQNGKGYLGVINDASNSNNQSDVEAFVLEFDPNNITAGFSTVLNFDPNIKRIGHTTWGVFKPWISNYTTPPVGVSGDYRYYAQPVLSDIEFDANGNMILSFFDRWGHQMGYWNYLPLSGNTTTVRPAVYGEILKACKSSGTWNIEGTSSCAGSSEFFQDISGDNESESSEGAVALLKGNNQILNVSIDPHPQGSVNSTYWTTQGVNTYNLSSGQIDNWYSFYQNAQVQLYGKANGLGDIELLLDPAPLEIGNRVWMDTDNDGAQDPDEMGLDGILVKLYNGTTLVATKTTANGGEYYFKTGDGLLPNTTYTIRIEGASFPSGKSLTLLNQPTGGIQDLGDNDASLVGGNADITYTTGGPGANDHTLDFGFKTAATCSVSVTSTPSSCNPANNQYSVTGSLTFSNAPTSGTLTVSIGAVTQTFNAPFTSPQAYTLSGLTSDGASHTVTAVFSADATCTNTSTYTAPIACQAGACTLSLTATPGACNPTNNQYSVTGSLTFSNAPASGTLTVSIGAVTQTFNAPFTSPQAYTLSGLTSDGVSHTATAVFSADVTCTGSVSYTAPSSCNSGPCPTPNCGTASIQKN